MRMILTILAVAAVILGGLAVFTELGVRRDRARPSAGRALCRSERRPAAPAGAWPRRRAPVVLLHGASGNLNDMRIALGDRLASRYRVILVDRPGHGWSDRPGGSADASPARQAALIHQALERIGVDARHRGRAFVVRRARDRLCTGLSRKRRRPGAARAGDASVGREHRLVRSAAHHAASSGRCSRASSCCRWASFWSGRASGRVRAATAAGRLSSSAPPSTWCCGPRRSPPTPKTLPN